MSHDESPLSIVRDCDYHITTPDNQPTNQPTNPRDQLALALLFRPGVVERVRRRRGGGLSRTSACEREREGEAGEAG